MFNPIDAWGAINGAFPSRPKSSKTPLVRRTGIVSCAHGGRALRVAVGQQRARIASRTASIAAVRSGFDAWIKMPLEGFCAAMSAQLLYRSSMLRRSPAPNDCNLGHSVSSLAGCDRLQPQRTGRPRARSDRLSWALNAISRRWEAAVRTSWPWSLAALDSEGQVST